MLLDALKTKPAADTETAQPDLPALTVSAATDPGCVREANEDDFFITETGCKPAPAFSCDKHLNGETLNILAVFDGMGGEAFGAEASKIAAETLAAFPFEAEQNAFTQESIRENVVRFIALANQRICDMIAERKCHRSGCTMALAVVYAGTVYAFSVGDSRIYRIWRSLVEQISEDQTLAVKKLHANIYTEEEARESPDAHRLTSYIGLDDRGVGVSYHAYEPFALLDHTVLLCSDGLTDMCSDNEICAVLSRAAQSPAQALVNAAKKNGGADNITCVVLKEAGNGNP